MATSRADRLAFAGLQTARVVFYGAHYFAARMMARDQPRIAKPSHPVAPLSQTLRDVARLFAQDWKNVEAGLYPAPLDLAAEIRAARASARYLADMPSVLDRRRKRVHNEIDGKGEGLPSYYRRNFHYQTDGYLSDHSAGLYDFQVEALFAGTADAMRRRAFVPIAHYLARRKLKAPKLLDAGAGTGRFLSFVQSVRPEVRATALDLSEPYLARAKKRAAKTGQKLETLAAPAEKIPLPDNSQDIVTAIYLFHELPPKVRTAVAKEIARVLKPGGLFVLADSIQYGDAPGFDGQLDIFPELMHEPYYASYAKTDLKQLFAKDGLVPGRVDIAYLTKIMAFEKPKRARR